MLRCEHTIMPQLCSFLMIYVGEHVEEIQCFDQTSNVTVDENMHYYKGISIEVFDSTRLRLCYDIIRSLTIRSLTIRSL